MTETTRSVNVAITGMTCAACVNRVTRKLNKLPGVEATVNLATESAFITLGDASVSDEQVISTIEAAGYGGHLIGDDTLEAIEDIGTGDAPLLPRMIVAFALALPVVLVSMISGLQFEHWYWYAMVASAPVVFWSAWPFHSTAARNARHGASTMDTLVSVGILAAFFWSTWVVISGEAARVWNGMGAMDSEASGGLFNGDAHVPVYFEVAVVVTAFLLLGRTLEGRARQQATAGLRALADLGAKDVTIVGPDGSTSVEPISALREGQRFEVRSGGRVAADGIVREGQAAIDASMLTGESLPIEVGPGDHVTGGTLAVGGRLIIEATAVGSSTRLAQIRRLVEQAQTGKARVQELADRVSAVFVPFVFLLAIGTFAAWMLTGHTAAEAISSAIAVLIIACPCALGLAMPTAMVVASGRGARLGLLIRSASVVQDTRKLTMALLDKTGTLTTGQMAVADTAWVSGVDGASALREAAAVEALSEHPIAAAIAAATDHAGLNVTDFEVITGQGAHGSIDGVAVAIGRSPKVDELPTDLAAKATEWDGLGHTIVAVRRNDSLAGLIAVADTVKEGAAQAIADLKALGLRPVMVTGDGSGAAHRVAAEVGIAAQDVYAECTPETKLELVEEYQGQGEIVAVVGDGVNDAAALSLADVGVAMGSGTDAAIEASDLTIVDGDITSVVAAIRLSKRTLRTIQQNLVWAFGYNFLALPVAAMGLLNPMIAGVAMAFSSVLVVANSLRLRSFRL